MKLTPLRLTLLAALAAGAAGPAMAQAYYDTPSQTYTDPQDQADYQARLQEYQAQQDAYQAQRQDYENRAQNYQSRRDAYSQQRDRYADQRDAYAAQRDDYEAQRDYDARYGSGAWQRRYGSGSSRNDDWYRAYAYNDCERRSSGSGAATGGVIGALAGAAIGSNVAGRGDRTEGAVLGAVAGGALGAAVGSSTATARCDSRGYYYSYDQTYPYREVADAGYGGRYGYYRDRRCRLAVAPAYVNGDTDYRYVRVCPDGSGRYRITP